jgi:transposase
VILAICWAHVRRDFIDLSKSYPKLSQWSEAWVERIGLIYKLNDVRLAANEPEKFYIAHAELKKALNSMVTQMKQELEDKKCHFAIQKVLQSLSNHWKGLNIFVEHPEMPMDNNTAEQELRGPVTGRKGYYGSGSIWSAELAASMFTITRTLKIWKLNSLTWLHTYLEYCLHNNKQPPKDLRPFLPWLMDDERRKFMTKPLTIFPKLNTS